LGDLAGTDSAGGAAATAAASDIFLLFLNENDENINDSK
jgi:hypothetical protein